MVDFVSRRIYEEQALIRAGAKITDWTQEFYQSLIRPGRLVCDIDGLIGLIGLVGR